MPPPVPSSPPILSGADAGTGTVGEAFAIAPGTFVVPGAWPARPDVPGLLFRSLVVRSRATAVVDTAPACVGPDWLAGVLALVEPDDVRWVVVTGLDPARTGCVGELLALCPRATVVAPGRGRTTLDLGPDESLLVHDGVTPAIGSTAPLGPPVAPPGGLVVEVPHRRVVWSDAIAGTFPERATDLARLTDAEVRAGLAHRPRPLLADEPALLAALAPRVLASPTGPAARGPSVARALRLLAEPAAPPTTVVTDLLARLGATPWAPPPSSA